MPANDPRGRVPLPSVLLPRGAPWGVFAGAFGLAALVATGCTGGGGGDAAAEPEQAPKKAEAEEKKAPEAPTAAVPQDEYSYNPIGKRDPFRSFIAKDVVTPVDADSQLGPLQTWELDQFRLVAIVWGDDRPTAMVQDPEGTGHVVEVGTLIGKNWGRVTQVKPDEIVVTEEYRDEIENRLIVKEIPIRLPTSDGGMHAG